MNYKNKLMGLSLIIVAMFSACSDEVENAGRDSGTGDHRITFAVSTQNQPNGTRSAFSSETHELGSVKMEGKLDGKPVYLTAEISDGFPGDNQPLTRGTQVTDAKQVDEFSVSAYVHDPNMTPSITVMNQMKVTKDGSASVWRPQETCYWPVGQTLDFFAWYPCEATGMSIADEFYNGASKMVYEVPGEVSEQQDIMIANTWNASVTSTVSLAFKHMLAAVKFKASADMPACTIKTITLKNIEYKGYRSLSLVGSGISPWMQDSDKRDFTLNVNTKLEGYTETNLTEEGKTFFMMPQSFSEYANADASLEVLLEMNGQEQTLSVKLMELGNHSWSLNGINGTTSITYKLSHSWAWEEPSRNLPAGKQLLTNEAHSLTYDFAVTEGKAPIHNGQGKFVITPIYADGSVCSDIAATEVPFTVTEEQTKVTLDLDANPNYNLLRMISIVVTNPNGTEKTLNTVDFQEAKTDANNIVIWPNVVTSDLTTYGNSGSVVAGKTVAKNGTITRGNIFDLGYSEMIWKDDATNSGDMTTNGSSMQNGIDGCEAAMKGWDGIWNSDTEKLTYLNGSDIHLPATHTHKSCYGAVQVNLNNWMLGFWTYSIQGKYSGYWDYRTTTSRNTGSFEDGQLNQNKITTKSKQFVVDLLDKQQAGLENQKPWYDQWATGRWYLEKDETILNKAAATAFWGYVTARCIPETNSYNLEKMGDYRMRVEIVPHNATQMDANTAFYDCGTHVHRANQPTSGNVTEHPSTSFGHICVAYKEQPRNKNEQNQAGYFYWDDTYQIVNVSWSLSRAATGIAENANTDMNKQ